MDAVINATVIYLVLLLVFRVAGKRELGQITTFDFVLLLILGEATQQALLGEDFSVTRAIIVIVTLVGIDIAFSLIKRNSPRFDRLVDGTPLVIVEYGKPLHERMHKARVDLADVLSAARGTQGLERLDEIKYAVLERNGTISVIPMQK